MGYNVARASQILGTIQIVTATEWNCYWTTGARIFPSISIAATNIRTDMVSLKMFSLRGGRVNVGVSSCTNESFPVDC